MTPVPDCRSFSVREHRCPINSRSKDANTSGCRLITNARPLGILRVATRASGEILKRERVALRSGNARLDATYVGS